MSATRPIINNDKSEECPSPFRSGKTLRRTPPGMKYPAPAPPARVPAPLETVNTASAPPAPAPLDDETVTPQNTRPDVTAKKEISVNVKEKLRKYMHPSSTIKSAASPSLKNKKLYNPKRQASVSPESENPHVKKHRDQTPPGLKATPRPESIAPSPLESKTSKPPESPPKPPESPSKPKANEESDNKCEYCEVESKDHEAMKTNIENLTMELENVKQILDKQKQEIENYRSESTKDKEKIWELKKELENNRTSARFYEGENANLHKKLLDVSAENKSQKEQIHNLKGVITENEAEKFKMIQKLNEKEEIKNVTMKENVEPLEEKSPDKVAEVNPRVPKIAILTTSMGRGLDIGLQNAGFDVELHMYEGAKIETLNNKALEIFKDNYKPEKIIIYGGGNDARWRSAPEVMKEYKNFIKTLQALCPNSKILIMQIPPRNHHGKNPRSWNRIRIINDSLKIHVRDLYMSQVKETLHESHRIEIINPMPAESKYFRTNDGIHFETNGVEFTVENLIRICNLCPNFRESPAVQITAL